MQPFILITQPTDHFFYHSGDLMTPPDAAKVTTKKTKILGKGMKAKTIRQGGKGNKDDDDSSDEDDW